MVGAKGRVFKRNDRASEHVLDRADEVAVDADHVAVRRQRQRLALLRGNRPPLQDHASVGGEEDRRRRFLRAVGPDQLHAEFHGRAPANEDRRSGTGSAMQSASRRRDWQRRPWRHGDLRHHGMCDIRPGPLVPMRWRWPSGYGTTTVAKPAIFWGIRPSWM